MTFIHFNPIHLHHHFPSFLLIPVISISLCLLVSVHSFSRAINDHFLFFFLTSFLVSHSSIVCNHPIFTAPFFLSLTPNSLINNSYFIFPVLSLTYLFPSLILSPSLFFFIYILLFCLPAFLSLPYLFSVCICVSVYPFLILLVLLPVTTTLQED